MTDPKLHYVHDPLCGWCYAVTSMVDAVAATGMTIALHGGGLWESAASLAPDKRAYVRRADARIADLTGVTFGPAYLDGLLADPHTLFWSRPTIAAVLAAGRMEQGTDLRMMHAIQRAHYIDGQRVVEPEVLAKIAGAIGLSQDAFSAASDTVAVDDHIDGTRRWMRELGLGGFPSFLVERDGELTRVEHEPFYGRPDAFLRAVTAMAAPIEA